MHVPCDGFPRGPKPNKRALHFTNKLLRRGARNKRAMGASGAQILISVIARLKKKCEYFNALLHCMAGTRQKSCHASCANLFPTRVNMRNAAKLLGYAETSFAVGAPDKLLLRKRQIVESLILRKLLLLSHTLSIPPTAIRPTSEAFGM